MHTGRCSHCHASTVHANDDALVVRSWALVLRLNFLNRASLRTYVCTTCGYTEQYVLDQESRDSIVRKWPKVEEPTLPVIE